MTPSHIPNTSRSRPDEHSQLKCDWGVFVLGLGRTFVPTRKRLARPFVPTRKRLGRPLIPTAASLGRATIATRPPSPLRRTQNEPCTDFFGPGGGGGAAASPLLESIINGSSPAGHLLVTFESPPARSPLAPSGEHRDNRNTRPQSSHTGLSLVRPPLTSYAKTLMQWIEVEELVEVQQRLRSSFLHLEFNNGVQL